MAAAQLACGAAVSCGLSNASSKWDFPVTNYKGCRCFLGRRRGFDGGRAGERSLYLDRTKLLLSCPIIRRGKPFFRRFNCQLSPDCNVESSDVEETVALDQEGPRYDYPFCFMLHVDLEKNEVFVCMVFVALKLLATLCATVVILS